MNKSGNTILKKNGSRSLSDDGSIKVSSEDFCCCIDQKCNNLKTIASFVGTRGSYGEFDIPSFEWAPSMTERRDLPSNWSPSWLTLRWDSRYSSNSYVIITANPLLSTWLIRGWWLGSFFFHYFTEPFPFILFCGGDNEILDTPLYFEVEGAERGTLIISDRSNESQLYEYIVDRNIVIEQNTTFEQ